MTEENHEEKDAQMDKRQRLEDAQTNRELRVMRVARVEVPSVAGG